MRLIASAVLLTLSLAPRVAHAEKGVHLGSDQCGFTTPFDVQADASGLALTRAGGAPRVVFIHDGTLKVDGAVQTVTPADAGRLRAIESGSVALMPEVAGIAREAVDISFEAFGATLQALSGSDAKAKKFQRYRADAIAQVDRTLGRGIWKQDVFDAQFEASIEAAATEFAGSMTRGVMWSLLTGGAGRMEKRMDKMGDALDKRMEARGDALDARAKGLCIRVTELRGLQEQLDYRLPGGARLDIIEPRKSDTLPPSTTVQAKGAAAAG